MYAGCICCASTPIPSSSHSGLGSPWPSAHTGPTQRWPPLGDPPTRSDEYLGPGYRQEPEPAERRVPLGESVDEVPSSDHHGDAARAVACPKVAKKSSKPGSGPRWEANQPNPSTKRPSLDPAGPSSPMISASLRRREQVTYSTDQRGRCENRDHVADSKSDRTRGQQDLAAAAHCHDECAIGQLTFGKCVPRNG